MRKACAICEIGLRILRDRSGWFTETKSQEPVRNLAAILAEMLDLDLGSILNVQITVLQIE